MRVESLFNSPASGAVLTGKPVSYLDIGEPAQAGINHLLGHLLGGMRVHQNCDYVGTASPQQVFRFKTYRHPNCNHLIVGFMLRGTVSDESGDITVTAGGAQGITRTIYGTARGGYEFFFPAWDSGDTGDCEVVIESEIGFSSIAIWDCPRAELTSSDTRMATVDDSYTVIGIGEGNAIAQSDVTGPRGMKMLIDDCWDYYQRQIVGWCVDETHAFTTTTDSPSFDDIIGGTTGDFNHQARRKTSSTTTGSRWHIRSKCDAGTSYNLRVSSNSGNMSSGSLSNTSYAWTELSSRSISTSGDDALIVRAQRLSGAGTVYVNAISALEGA